MGEKCYIDMTLLQFSEIGLRRLKKIPPEEKINLVEVILIAHKVLQKIDLINRKCKPDDKIVDFTENGLVIDEKIIKKLEVSSIRGYNLSEEGKNDKTRKKGL